MHKKIKFVVCMISLATLIGLGASLGVSAKTGLTTTLRLTAYQIVVTDGVAGITGPAAGARVELYDNLGEQLIDSGITDAYGTVVFTLDDRYPLSGRGLYHTAVFVDGSNNGVISCVRDQTCRVDLFSVHGLDPAAEDGILVVKVVRSADKATPVSGINLHVWPADFNGIPLPFPIVGTGGTNIREWSGVGCMTNETGWCAAYFREYFKWDYTDEQNPKSKMVLRYENETVYDGKVISVPEGLVQRAVMAVDERGRLDDCVFQAPPNDKLVSQSCMEKIKQTATAQANRTVDPLTETAMKAENEVVNNAIAQASMLSRETYDLFTAHKPDLEEIDALIKKNSDGFFDPAKQVKIILTVNRITHDDHSATIAGRAVGSTVEITSPDDPDRLLGACQANILGECISVIEKSTLLSPTGLLSFRVLVDGYDNGILVCRDDALCEPNVYMVVKFSGMKDAIALYRVVRAENFLIPIPEVTVKSGIHFVSAYGGMWIDSAHLIENCVTDENGTCALYLVDQGFSWKVDNKGDFVHPSVLINNGGSQDANLPFPYDNQMIVYYVALDDSGKVTDCTFTSPLEFVESKYNQDPYCLARKKALQTAIAGYTATPTVTITPTVTLTPTVTATPLPSATPTATLIPTPTPQPGLFAGGSTPLTIGGIVLLIVLLGGGAWWILRGRNKRS